MTDPLALGSACGRCSEPGAACSRCKVRGVSDSGKQQLLVTEQCKLLEVSRFRVSREAQQLEVSRRINETSLDSQAAYPSSRRNGFGSPKSNCFNSAFQFSMYICTYVQTA